MADKFKTLSQAIRFGARLHPSWNGGLFRLQLIDQADENSNGIVATCAMGAALVAVMGEERAIAFSATRKAINELAKLFPDIKTRRFKSPAVEDAGWSSRYTADQLVVHLNDAHNWSREQIADWLESKGL